MSQIRLTTLVLVAAVALATGCSSRGKTDVRAENLPGGATRDAARAGQTPGGPGQGTVTGRGIGGPLTDAPGGAAPDAQANGQAPADGQPGANQQVAGLPPAVETPAGPVHEVAALRDVYFDFDSAQINEQGRQALEFNATWMQRNAAAKVLIEGHTDQRGSTAYNLALGERRAIATRDYLVTLGVPKSRLSTISYGKERPADPGSNEAAWAKNRRAHFVVIGQGAAQAGTAPSPQSGVSAASTQQ
jgi:peptidoglycan-associated lipoprotein